MNKAIVVAAAAIVLMVTGILFGKSRTESAAAPSSQHASAFDLMATAKGLPIAPHTDAF
jgi:hypothetical protein